LNYPDHRVTLGVVWRPSDMVEVRIITSGVNKKKIRYETGQTMLYSHTYVKDNAIAV
jgi:vitamin B12 transporter